MNKLNDIFNSIKKSFTLQKKVEFGELGITVILEPMSSLEELKVLEACKEFEGGSYIESLKKSSLAYSIKQVNDFIFDQNEVIYEDEQGQQQRESKYLFLLHQLENWPAAVIERLFEVFTNLHEEVEQTVNKKTNFEKFTAQQEPKIDVEKEAGVPEGFKLLKKDDSPVEDSDMDKINKQVEQELDKAQHEIDSKNT